MDKEEINQKTFEMIDNKNIKSIEIRTIGLLDVFGKIEIDIIFKNNSKKHLIGISPVDTTQTQEWLKKIICLKKQNYINFKKEKTMLSEEEKQDIEDATNIILRGIDIESSALILEKAIMDNYIISKGRVNRLKIATRQILNFIEEHKNKGYLDVVKEKVKVNEERAKLQQENKEKDKQIDLMAEYINYLSDELVKETGKNELAFCNMQKCIDDDNIECEDCIKEYFEKLAKEKGE